MKANRIFNYDEIKSILSAYNNHLKEFDLSKPLVTKIDLLCWGKTNNLVVFFKTDNIKFKSSVFFNEDYCARDKSICFKNLELTGRELELFISWTKRGYLNIQNAKLLEI